MYLRGGRAWQGLVLRRVGEGYGELDGGFGGLARWDSRGGDISALKIFKMKIRQASSVSTRVFTSDVEQSG